MNKVLTISRAIKLSTRFKQEAKSIVLAGGCFDILHKGHILFLEAAKKQGDKLFVLLESDENISKKKGAGRPVNSIKDRSAVLSSIEVVDFVIPLTGVTKDKEYDRLMVKIRPDIVALTQGDPQISKRRKQCELVGAKLKLVIKRVENKSTTALISKTKN
ncbi:MAG: adenylyltransferase/cytidyltransferase family protein [Candidatus Levybacteria bacterium]|nr:adenylyltransferase/cytidyltransferase family protein [Candidatus Levybacteria bacterium]